VNSKLFVGPSSEMPAVAARVPRSAQTFLSWYVDGTESVAEASHLRLSQRLLDLENRARIQESWRTPPHAPRSDLFQLHHDLPATIDRLVQSEPNGGLAGPSAIIPLDRSRLGSPSSPAETILCGASHSAVYTVLFNTWHLISVDINKPRPTTPLDWNKRFAGPYHDISRALVVWQRADPPPPVVCAVKHMDLPGEFLAVTQQQWPGQRIDTIWTRNQFDPRSAQALYRARAAAEPRPGDDSRAPTGPGRVDWNNQPETRLQLVNLAATTAAPQYAQVRDK